jgi:glycosyltransferase involved in cell wall biosynthesis
VPERLKIPINAANLDQLIDELENEPPVVMIGRRILHVCDSLQIGGAERVLVGLAAGLVARGARVTVACSAGGSLALEAERAGVDVRMLGTGPVKRRFDAAFAGALAQLIVNEPPDLVHTHMYASTVAATLALQQSRIPLVVHEHSEAGWRDREARRSAAVAHRRSAVVIAVSGAIRRRLVDVDGVAPAKVRVLHNTLPRLPGRAVGVVGLPRPDGPLVGVVARLQPEKGVAVFVRAAARLAQSVPDAGYVVVGDGPQRGMLERLAADLGAAVTFLGFRPDGPALMGGLDLLVIPSLTEGTPLVLLEGAAAGVPLVATAVGGIPEQVRDGIEGVLVPPGDDRALANACRRILADRAFGARLAAAAAERLGQADPEAAVNAVADLYAHVLRAQPVPAETL